MTSFLYLVSYRAHCGAIVAVFISGPKHAQGSGEHKSDMHPCSLSLFPHVLPCAGTVLRYCWTFPSILLAVFLFQHVKFLHFRVAPLRMYHYLQFCLKV